MATLITNRARAWLYCGDWVADCPLTDCANVEFLFDLIDPQNPNSARTVRKPTFWCSNCKQVAEVEWCAAEAEVMDVVGRRPVPQTRNWYPADHPLAVLAGLPHGQTIADLLAENREHGVR